MSTFSVDTTSTSINTGIRITIAGVLETHQTTRSFYKVDLTSSGYTVDDIANVNVRLYNTATTGGGLTDAHFYCGSSGDNWNGSLVGNNTVFNSTRTYLESEFPITTTGYFWVPVNIAHLDFNGWNWFTLNSGSIEYTYGVSTTVNCSIASQDNSTASLRPVLILYFKNGGIKVLNLFVEEITLSSDDTGDVIQMSGFKSNNYFGDSADGYVRKIDVIATGDPYDPDA